MLTVDWHKFIPETYIYDAFGLVMIGLFAVARFIVKKVIESLKSEWKAVTERLERIEDVQGVQAENHLNTIQAESLKQTDLLTEMVKEQAGTNGYLKALVDLKKPL
jgi:hypothetical protein